MKHSTKIICIELAFIITSLFCLFVFSIHYYTYLGILIGLTIFSHFLLRTSNRNERFDTDILLVTLIVLLFYYALTYFLGFFTGFYYSTYSRSLLGIFTNLITGMIVVYSIETIRESFIKNYAYHKSIVWFTPIVCLLLEIPSLMNVRLFQSRVDIFNAFLTILLPAIIKNIVLTYITYKSNKKNSILYQILFLFPAYLLPVTPNLGNFFSIIIQTLLPVFVLLFIMNISTIKFSKIVNSRKLGSNKIPFYIVNTFIVVLLVIMIYLISNVFRFSALAIGSESMKGSINKGDIVIIDKKDNDVKENDFIAFNEHGRIIVHRAIKLIEKNDQVYYQTKGDANETKDAWLVSPETYVGKVKLRIRFIGWPTVALSELLQE